MASINLSNAAPVYWKKLDPLISSTFNLAASIASALIYLISSTVSLSYLSIAAISSG